MRFLFSLLLVIPLLVLAKNCYTGKHFLNGPTMTSVQCPNEYPCYRIKPAYGTIWEMGCDNQTKYCNFAFHEWSCDYYTDEWDVKCCCTGNLCNDRDL